jgi:ATP-dependent DNA helicase RecG
MTVNELLGISPLENAGVEFKARLNREDTEGWLKTVAGFSNADGGTLYVGVEDKSGKLLGFTEAEADGERNYFNNTVNQHIFPNPAVQIRFIPYDVREKQLLILEIRIGESAAKPVVLKYHNIPSIYMRRDGYTNGATYEEIINMCRKSDRTQYDAVVSSVRYDRNDFSKLIAFHSEKTNGKELTDKVLLSLGFFNEEGFLSNGALLFRDDYKGDKTMLKCSVFSGLTRGSDRIDNIRKFNGNIIDSINDASDFVMENSVHSVIKLSDRHVDLYSYPRRAVMEGVVNAYAHRDYFLDGTQIDVTVFRNRLEISSPGGFYGSNLSGRIDDLGRLISKRRNEIICGVLVKCDVMEAAGTGYEKILEDYADADESHRPYVDIQSDHFTLVLPDLTYAGGVDDDAAAVSADGESEMGKRIIIYCVGKARSAEEIAGHLKVSNSTFLRKTLGRLEEKGYISSVKKGRTKYYSTDVRALG